MDADAFPQEVLADEEPKYLRRQKPLEIKRRKFGKKAWKTYARVAMWTGAGLVAAAAAYVVGDFLYSSRHMALIHPEQVEVATDRGEPLHFVTQASVRGIFAADRNHSVLAIPLDARRRQLEAIPWVELATVRRALPNKIEVEITERTPIAFLRQGSDMALVDAHGVILERPLEGDFNFPVVTGIRADMEAEDREKRMQLFAGFLQQVEAARPGSVRQSERSGSFRRERFARDDYGFASGQRIRRRSRFLGTVRLAIARPFWRRRLRDEIFEFDREHRQVARHGGPAGIARSAIQRRSGGQPGSIGCAAAGYPATRATEAIAGENRAGKASRQNKLKESWQGAAA